MTAKEKLYKANSEGKFICIGLDTDITKIPAHLRDEPDAILSFNKQIIEATCKDAAAFKLNFAFYEKFGSEGFEILEKTLKIIPEENLIIGDAKRGDIGNTSLMYASSVFDYFGCDSVTVSPYMGEDSVKPFLENSDKLVFILALTSNPGANDFEKLRLSDGSFLFQEVISRIHKWNEGNCGIVFGATKIDELKGNMDLIGQLPVLLPGVGAQGGSLEDVVNTFKEFNRSGYLVNISRGIIYKSGSEDFAVTARNELQTMNDTVQKLLNK